MTLTASLLFVPLSLCANEQIVVEAQNLQFNDPDKLIEPSQRQEIVNVAQSIPERKDPVLRIDVVSKTEVDITTGVIRSPFDRGGIMFKLRKVNGKWIYIKEELQRSWCEKLIPL